MDRLALVGLSYNQLERNLSQKMKRVVEDGY